MNQTNCGKNMWDFIIILGRVPGTDFQITFLEIICGVGVAIIVSVFLKKQKKLRKKIVQTAEKVVRIRNLPIVKPQLNENQQV